MSLESELSRLRANLGVSETDPEEVDIVDREWRNLGRTFRDAGRKIEFRDLAFIEEILDLRITVHRLRAALARDSLFPKRAEGSLEPGPLHPAVEGLAKTRERYRKAVSELSNTLGTEEEEPLGGLGMLLKRLICEMEEG